MLRIFAVSAIGIALAAFVHAQTDPQPETRSCAAWSTGEFLPIASRLDVQACLDAGADINSQSENEFGLAPLHLAVVAKNTQAITALLKADANTEIQDYVSGQTPLHYAAKYGTARIINLLIDAGAIIDAEDHSGATPLHVAASSNPETLDALLDATADVKARDKNGATPLHNAAEVSGSARNINALLKAGANIEARTKNGSTPLHWAAAMGKTETVNALIVAGANIEAKSNIEGVAALPIPLVGVTPLHYAAGWGSAEIVTALLDAGADALTRTEEGVGITPFDLATQNENLKETDAYWRLNEARFK